MSVFVRGGVSIHYEQRGRGAPVLLLAPGGMDSTIEAWERAPFTPFDVYADEFHVVAMDQRNTGRTHDTLDVRDPWGSYADDQLQLMDHLGLETFHVIGMCVGCAFALKLAERAPARLAAAVLLQPIGLLEENRTLFERMWHDWRDELLERREDVAAEEVDAFGREMWGHEGFVGSVSRDAVRSMRTPMLVMPGVDAGHPAAIAREIASLAPAAELWEPWRSTPGRVAETVARIREFLRAHSD